MSENQQNRSYHMIIHKIFLKINKIPLKLLSLETFENQNS